MSDAFDFRRPWSQDLPLSLLQPVDPRPVEAPDPPPPEPEPAVQEHTTALPSEPVEQDKTTEYSRALSARRDPSPTLPYSREGTAAVAAPGLAPLPVRTGTRPLTVTIASQAGERTVAQEHDFESPSESPPPTWLWERTLPMSSVPKGRLGWLETPWGERVPGGALNGERVVIGRGDDCEVQVLDRSISRHHAELQIRGGAVWVVDLDSKNGVAVNGYRDNAHPLQDGDIICVGGLRFRWCLNAD